MTKEQKDKKKETDKKYNRSHKKEIARYHKKWLAENEEYEKDRKRAIFLAMFVLFPGEPTV